MSDAKINIEVVCEEHPTEKLNVVTESGGNFYNLRLLVSKCAACDYDSVTQAFVEDKQ